MSIGPSNNMVIEGVIMYCTIFQQQFTSTSPAFRDKIFLKNN